MSTILDALRKLQRERDVAKRPDLDLRGSVVAPAPEPPARHRPLHGLLLIGVTAGMATGALLLYAYGWPRRAGDVDAEARAKAEARTAPDAPRAPGSPPEMEASPQGMDAGDAVPGPRAPFAHVVPSDETEREDEAVPRPTPSELRRARRQASAGASVPEPTADRAPAPPWGGEPFTGEPGAPAREDAIPVERPHAPSVPAAEPRPTVVGPTPPPPIRVGHIRWHPDPERREVSLELEDVRIPNAHEGDIVSGVLVRRIDPDSVEIQIGSARRRVPLAP